jgi:hypothetical protein
MSNATTEPTRAEHLAWCKRRAIEYVDRGDLRQAFISFASDMRKHKETADHPALLLGVQMMMIGKLDTVAEMRRFIEGFN